MQQMRHAGEFSQAIANRLNDDGHRPTRGNLLSPVAVHRILNRTYWYAWDAGGQYRRP